jgi:hypothetical protein
MEEGLLHVGGQTMAHPLGVSALLLCCSFILFGHRRYVVPALLILIFAIPSAQRVVLLSIDFSFLRIAILAALVKAIFKGESNQLSLARPDRLLIFWMLWGIIAYGLLIGTMAAALTRTGYMIDAVGAYFVGRIYVRSWDELRPLVRFLGFASIPVVMVFLIERSTGRNMFAVFGGISEYTLVREGQLRCQGPFSHPIMAGLFWASILPFFYVLWVRREASKLLLLLMLGSVLLIIINTASSTPVMAVVLIVIGLRLFSFRQMLPLFRWLVIFILVAAQIIMEKGAAHLLARVNVISGSTGWHRYHLIDQALNHIGEWWLVGTRSTQHWGMGLEDVTNQYVLEGVRGGLLGMVLFVLFLMALFKVVGNALSVCDEDEVRWIYWCAGIILFVHIFTFLSVSYFGQMVASFFLFAGVIASISINFATDRANQQHQLT